MGERAKILLVDDDDDLRDTLADWLAMAGHEVVQAADGADALEWARWDAFDVVVTDLRMPRLDGLALLGELRAIAPGVRVIFLSGEATKAEAIEALREGRSFDFLEKPLADLGHLTDAVSRALRFGRPAPFGPASGPGREPGLASGPPSPSEPAIEPGAGLAAVRPAPLRFPSAGVGGPAPADGASPAPKAGAHPALGPAFAFIREHLASAISLRHVAEAIGYSPAHLTSVVREATGLPVTQWIAVLRVERAKALLRETDLAIARIAEAVGVPDASYFARVFRRVAGVSPQAWREGQAP